jgi:hypothetical protein
MNLNLHGHIPLNSLYQYVGKELCHISSSFSVISKDKKLHFNAVPLYSTFSNTAIYYVLSVN